MWMLSRGFALVLLGAAVQAQSVWLPAPSAETAAPAHRPSSTLVMSSVEARLAGTWPQGHAEFRYVAELVSAVRAAGADDERRGRRCASARFVAIQWQSPWCGVASELHAAATYRSPELPTGYRGPGGDPQSDQRQHGWMADAIGRSAGPEATEATSLHFAFVAMRDENVRDTAFGSMTEVFPMARAPRDVADQAEREATIEIGFGASVRASSTVTLRADVHMLREERLSVGSLPLLPALVGGGGNDWAGMGTELGLSVSLRLREDTSLRVGCGRLFASGLQTLQGPAEDVDFVYASVLHTF
jgi:hypothetical protein